MSDRYTRLFTLPANLYAEGAPLLIAAGALLKDNRTGKLIAQLKFRSVSEKDILAVKVKLVPLDLAEKPLDTEVTYQYLDLCAARDEDFGSKTPVFLPDPAARSYTAAVSEVVFADKTFWQSAGQPWETLPAPEPLEGALEDAETLKQYHLQYGADCQYKPLRQKDLWYCACGGLNRQEEPTCHCCGMKFTEWNAAFIQELTAKRDERLAEEKKAHEEQLAAKREQKRKAKKFAKRGLIIVAPVISVILIIVIILNTVVIPRGKYNDAVTALEAGNTMQAAMLFGAANNYKDAAERSETLWHELANTRNTIAVGHFHSVGLRSDGTVAATGEDYGQCDVSGWSDIVSVAAGRVHSVGLKADGTVVAVGENYGQCDVEQWKEMAAIAAGAYHTLGLKADGTVVAVGDNDDGRCDVSGWKDIVAVTAGFNHTVGLKSDGTVLAVGENDSGQCNVSDWTDITAIAAGGSHTLGLKADGTVVAAGNQECGQCNVQGWTDIVGITAGYLHTVGLRSDGTVVAVGEAKCGQCDVGSWENIVAIAAGRDYTLGLRADGTVVAAGGNDFGQCSVSDWTDIRLPK